MATPHSDELFQQLERLQAERDRLTEEIREIQSRLALEDRQAAVQRHLDSLPLEDQGALIRAAAAAVGHGDLP